MGKVFKHPKEVRAFMALKQRNFRARKKAKKAEEERKFNPNKYICMSKEVA